MFRLSKFSLANRALVALFTLIIAAFGLFSMTQLKQELIPPIELPQSQIVTAIPGASPEVMDQQVSEPVTTALRDITGVESVVSKSSSGLSLVSVAYAYGTDAKEFKASLADALSGLKDTLPEGADPQVVSGSTSALPIVFLTAAADGEDPAHLTAQVQDTVVPTLSAIEGIRDVTVSGGESYRVVITPDPAALAAAGISPTAISDALKANGMTLPLGSITEDGVLMPVQGGDPIESLDALREIPIASTTHPGTVITLGDVATVDTVTEAPTSITRTNGVNALSIMVTATQDADVVGVSHAVDDALVEMKDELDGVELTTVFSQAPFIEESIQHLAIEGLLGLLFAIIVILLFLRSVRSTLVTAISIPLSVLVTFIGLNLGGYSLNVLTLGALTIAIGRVVDDSIVVIENIKRHLSYGEPKRDAILSGVREVAGAVTSSTLTTVAVFLPIAFVGGLVGELFAPFALTVTIAMVSSLFVALTIVPVLSFWFLRQPKTTTDAETTRVAAEEKEHKGWLQRGYTPILRGTQRHPVITVTASALLLVFTLALVPLLKVDFLGSSGQNSISLTQTFPAGTDLQAISDSAVDVEDALMDVDGVETVMMTASSGGGGSLFSGGGSGSVSYIVTTANDADQAAVRADVTDAVSDIGGSSEITLGNATAGGLGGTVDVLVTAPDDEALASAADTVFTALQDTPDTADVTTDLAPAQPIVQVTVDRSAALEHGLTEVQLLGYVASVLTPQSIGTITLDGQDLRIFVDSQDPPATVEQLSALQVPTAAGLVPLNTLSTVAEETVPTSITRQSGDLVATISITPDEGELGAVTTSVNETLADTELPSGATAAIGGLAQTQTDSFTQLGLAMLVAIAIVFLVLVATFRSLIQPLILLVSIPFAATGAIALLLITGRPLGISALIGMLMLIGIVVTNAIVLIDLVNQYRKQGQSVADAVYNGARQRLRPILMTALATIFALVPMALGVTGSAGFISQDLAIVVIGGLVSSTALTLILVPVLYKLVEGRRERRQARRADAEAIEAAENTAAPVGGVA